MTMSIRKFVKYVKQHGSIPAEIPKARILVESAEGHPRERDGLRFRGVYEVPRCKTNSLREDGR